VALRIVEHDDLQPGLESQVQLLDGTAGWGSVDFRKLKDARRSGYPAADYHAVYAVEHGEVLSIVRVIRVPYTTRRGTELVGAVQGVVTRRDQGRKGLARALLQDVHRREKEAGLGLVLLWTGRGQVAHALYESLGYVDVYTPDLAMKRCGAVAAPRGLKLRSVGASDVRVIEELHQKSTTGRPGFAPRPKRIVETVLKLGFRSPSEFKLVLSGEEAVGYAIFHRGPASPSISELVIKEGVPASDVLALFESASRGGWLAIRNTVVREHREALRARGYEFSSFNYYSLLATSLDRRRKATQATLGSTSMSFTCQQLDYF